MTDYRGACHTHVCFRRAELWRERPHEVRADLLSWFHSAFAIPGRRYEVRVLEVPSRVDGEVALNALFCAVGCGHLWRAERVEEEAEARAAYDAVSRLSDAVSRLSADGDGPRLAAGEAQGRFF